MKYNIEELDLKNDSYEEAVRTREIFDELKSRQEKGKKLFENEKNFFCKGVMLSKDDDGNIEDYKCCDNYRFKYLYLIYFHNLTLKCKYYKPQGVVVAEIPKKIAKRDLFYLWKLSDDWYNIINNTRISNELLKHLAKETREEVKILDSQYSKKNRFEYKTALRVLLLTSRYLYLKAVEIFELRNADDMKFELNGISIEFNEYSLIHVLKRHYGEITKKYKIDKSYHNEMIQPDLMHIKLKSIFKTIDESNIYKNYSIQEITFSTDGKIYRIFINERTKSVKGKGNVKYQRLETFYPLEDGNEINDLKSNYEFCNINKNLGIYKKKLLTINSQCKVVCLD